MIDISVAKTIQQFEALVPEWQELVESADDARELMHDPAVVRIMLTDSSEARAPHFIVIRKQGRVECIAPFYLQRTRVPLRLSVLKVASFRVRALRLFGDRVILRASQDPQEALHHVFSTLKDLRRSFDLLWIYTQRIGDPFWNFITSPAARRLSFRPVVTSPRQEKVHCLTFDRTFDEYRAELRSKAGFPGKTIRRFWRDMSERAAVTRVTEPAQVAAFLHDVDRVYNASWQARTYGRRRRDTPVEVDRLEAIASLGHLRSYVLTEEGMAIAFVIGYQYRGRYTYDETGYDLSRSASSPGSILTYAAIEDLFRSDVPRVLDFGFGDGAYKRTFGDSAYEVCSIYVVRRGRWRVILGAQQFLNAGYEVIRAGLVRVRLDAIIRRLLKRQR